MPTVMVGTLTPDGKTTTQLKELQPYSYDFWEGLLNAEKAGIQIKALN